MENNTKPSRQVKSKEATPDVCWLRLTIRDVDYGVTPHPNPTGRAWRLRRVDGKGTCIVAEGPNGSTCTCPDQEWRPRSQGCKHQRACRALGLIGR
jgi:hypothetical protein